LHPYPSLTKKEKAVVHKVVKVRVQAVHARVVLEDQVA